MMSVASIILYLVSSLFAVAFGMHDTKHPAARPAVAIWALIFIAASVLQVMS